MRSAMLPLLSKTSGGLTLIHRDLFNETLATQIVSHTPDLGGAYINTNNAHLAVVQAGNVGKILISQSSGGTEFTTSAAAALVELEFTSATDLGIMFGVVKFTTHWLLQSIGTNLKVVEQIGGSWFLRATLNVGAIGAVNILSIGINGLILTPSITIDGVLHSIPPFAASAPPPAGFGVRSTAQTSTNTRLEAWS